MDSLTFLLEFELMSVVQFYYSEHAGVDKKDLSNKPDYLILLYRYQLL